MAAYSDAALKAEIANDPAHLGYAGKDATQVAALLNAPTVAAYGPVGVDVLMMWGSPYGLHYNLYAGANAAGPYAPGQPRAITALAQGDCLSALAQIGLGIPFDFSSPAVVGAVAGGAAYTPGATLATPGMVDNLVTAKVMVDTAGNSIKDAMMALGATTVSRAQALFGAAAPVITADMVLAALRS